MKICTSILRDLALMKSIGRDVEMYRGTLGKSRHVYCGPLGDVMAAVLTWIYCSFKYDLV